MHASACAEQNRERQFSGSRLGDGGETIETPGAGGTPLLSTLRCWVGSGPARAKDDAGQALFESVCDRGTRWLFIVLRDDRWAITRNGERVATGTNDRVSLQAGVEKFVSLTRPIAAGARCDPVIREHLDRIEAADRSIGSVRLGRPGILEFKS